MTQTVNVRFSYEDKVSQEIPINLGVDIDLSNNKNRKRLLNRLLKSNPNITEVTLLSRIKMTLNKAQLVENYVSQIVEGLDTESLEVMVFDLLVREYETYTEEKIVGEIEELYGEEVAQDLVESVI